MAQVSSSSTTLIDADPGRALEAVADYRQVRPRILSPQYSDYQVVSGGQGRGTVAAWKPSSPSTATMSPSAGTEST